MVFYTTTTELKVYKNPAKMKLSYLDSFDPLTKESQSSIYLESTKRIILIE